MDRKEKVTCLCARVHAREGVRACVRECACVRASECVCVLACVCTCVGGYLQMDMN